MLHICFNKMLSGCVVCLLKYLGTKCPRLGTKCPSTKCTGTKCPGMKCPGTKCPYPVQSALVNRASGKSNQLWETDQVVNHI